MDLASLEGIDHGRQPPLVQDRHCRRIMLDFGHSQGGITSCSPVVHLSHRRIEVPNCRFCAYWFRSLSQDEFVSRSCPSCSCAKTGALPLNTQTAAQIRHRHGQRRQLGDHCSADHSATAVYGPYFLQLILIWHYSGLASLLSIAQ